MERGAINDVCEQTNATDVTKEDIIFAAYYLTVMSIICVICFIGTGLIIHAILCYRFLRHVTNWFILSLAVSDLFQALTIPFYTMGHPSDKSVLPGLGMFLAHKFFAGYKFLKICTTV